MRTICLVSDTLTPCGVESFQRRLAESLARAAPDEHTTCAIVGQPGEVDVLWRALDARDALIVSLPVVAWKKRIVAPLRAMATARRRGCAVILILHEWADLDWKRRATYSAYLPLATRILFSSPQIWRQFSSDPVSRLATANRGLVPIPPNLQRPAHLPRTRLTARLDALRASGTLVIGHFGSIYPKKQPDAVLDIAAELKARGRNVHVVFLGDFVRDATIDVRAAFELKRDALGLHDDVTVTGYIAADADVFAAMAACDVMVYRFAEGLTSRRGSVLACLQSGRPIVVNAPAPDAAAECREFDHHPAFQAALAAGALRLVPQTASATEFADAILALEPALPGQSPVAFQRAWHTAAAAVMSGSPPQTRHDTPPTVVRAH